MLSDYVHIKNIVSSLQNTKSMDSIYFRDCRGERLPTVMGRFRN